MRTCVVFRFVDMILYVIPLQKVGCAPPRVREITILYLTALLLSTSQSAAECRSSSSVTDRWLQFPQCRAIHYIERLAL